MPFPAQCRPRQAARSSSGVVMGWRSYFSCKTAATPGERKAGRVGPRRMPRMPSASKAISTQTAFCSNQQRMMERGSSLTEQSKASARPSAIRMAL